MALSKEEKEALADHYKNQDLYDPSKEPGQEPPSFACGGDVGYAEGGEVDGIDLEEPLQFGTSDYSGPALSADTDTARVPLTMPKSSPAPQLSALGLNPPQMPVPSPVAASPRPAGAAVAAPVASPSPLTAPSVPGGLSKAEFDQMTKYLQPDLGSRLGQGALSGLAGLADAIETGVARTNGSNFQKNIEETRQKQKENLLNALKAKYETGYKGAELGLRGKEIQQQGEHQKAEEKNTRRGQDLEFGQRGAQIGMEKNKLIAEENKNALEQAEKTGGIWNKLKGTVGLEVPGPDPKILARAQGSVPATGPYGPTVVRGGKTYEWSPVSHQYHPVK